jgi:hypothetical protein
MTTTEVTTTVPYQTPSGTESIPTAMTIVTHIDNTQLVETVVVTQVIRSPTPRGEQSISTAMSIEDH